MNIVAKDTMVSIVMATYNGREFLEEQLQSILDQTWSNIEIIICDDASSDGTQEIILAFAEQDNRVKYFFNKINTGVNKNFESGFLRTTGEFIAIADQDDVWKKNKIEEQLRLFSGDNTILTHSASVQFSDSELPVHKLKANTTKRMTGNDSRRLLIRNSISGHNIIFRRRLLQQVLPIPATVMYDWWICEVATCNGYINATDKVLAFHRRHSNNLTLYEQHSPKQAIKESRERTMALETFITITSMPVHTKIFAQELLEKLNTLNSKRFSWSLFIFLLTYASVLFYYKKKIFPYFSYIKAAYRLSVAENN